MTINSPAAMIFAMYLVVAEKQGADWKKISGTIQNDILKEFIAQKEYIFPPRPVDALESPTIFGFCSTRVPKWNTISVSGYHIREAGATAVQELAFNPARRASSTCSGASTPGSTSMPSCRRSRSSSNGAQRLLRGESPSTARRGRSGPRRCANPLSTPRASARGSCASTARTAGVSLTAQQPYNNVVRTALQALSAVLGGTNSLHTNSLDEALALPTAEAATLGAADAADHRPRKRRRERRRSARRLVFRREADQGHGGRRAGLLSDHRRDGRHGRRESSAASRSRRSRRARTAFQQAFERKEKIMVGVNAFVQQDDPPIEILYIDESASEHAARQTRGAAPVAEPGTP